MENNIGALWKKENEKGEFFTGHIKLDNDEKIKIVVFKNNYKNKDTQPDYQILKAREQKQDIQEDKIDGNDVFELTPDDLPF